MFHSQRVSSKNYSTAFGGGYKIYGVFIIEILFFLTKEQCPGACIYVWLFPLQFVWSKPENKHLHMGESVCCICLNIRFSFICAPYW
uniref:Uncharacterized protein n=1 Tax=Setaria viridis TaxID=4556 RepID=A0A4U6W4E0_SETVI|nr:hypothetical protein SEVIR_1G014250v2 [Setaria viridis]